MPDKEGDYYTAEGYYVPPRRRPGTDAGYLEVMAQAIFQAGFSWEVVRNKWPNFCKAFDEFTIDAVAAYSPDDLDRLVADKGIIRNARKIEAVIENARVMRHLIREHGSFHAYLRSLDELPYHKRRNKLARQFKWLGRTGVFVMLWCVGEEVPDWEDR
ncbi:MAG: DNA-3-methyladenine glycosylase I [Anaerolineae bacterium]|nr:DNA-3-methyladenine glycosylase I [Anaerolineae bacterium]